MMDEGVGLEAELGVCREGGGRVGEGEEGGQGEEVMEVREERRIGEYEDRIAKDQDEANVLADS